MESEEFLRCNGQSHNSLSNFVREKVPKELFRKNLSDPKSGFWKNCIDCRKKRAEVARNYVQKTRKDIESKGLIQCVDCMMAFEASEMAKNLDGSRSSSCVKCKKVKKKRVADRANTYRMIKMEMITFHECSCYVCKCLFFKPLDGSLIVGRMQTYLKDDGKRYVKHDDQEYLASYIIQELKNDLEIEIIQLDHLTEKEQRERGILKEHDKFIPKVNKVSALSSEHEMRLEAAKTQHVCVRCHISEGIKREKGKRKSPQELMKYRYIKELKKSGCVSCGLRDETCERFFEFDHIDPATKIEKIATMVQHNRFSLEDLKRECSKCRILCSFCHKMHTRIQIKLGLLKGFVKPDDEDTDT